MVEEEDVMVVAFYDTHTNTDTLLTTVENLLDDMEARNGIIVRGDFNTITNPLLDQVTSNKETKRMGNIKEAK